MTKTARRKRTRSLHRSRSSCTNRTQKKEPKEWEEEEEVEMMTEEAERHTSRRGKHCLPSFSSRCVLEEEKSKMKRGKEVGVVQ